MTPDFRGALIAIYGSKNTNAIGTDPGYRTLCDEHAGNMLFDAARNTIHEAKKRLENRMKGASTAREQVGEALQELNQQRLSGRPETKDISYRLIVSAYKPSWSHAQQDYFEHGWRLLQSKYDYFLSFTTRYEPPGNENPVHRQYRYFILSQVDRIDFKKVDLERQNLLALAVRRILAKPHIPVFFFEEKKNDNADVLKKLSEGCKESLVFVQLVQGIMFKDTAPVTNYTFFEYNEAKSAMAAEPDFEERLLFIVAENAPQDLPPIAYVPPQYEDWRKHVAAKAAPHLAEVPNNDLKRIAALTAMLRNDIGAKLAEARVRIWTNVPADV